MHKLLAQSLNVVDGKTSFQVKGPLENINTVGDLINRIMGTLLIPIASIILFLVFIWGAYDFLLSNGNPEKVKSGRAKITAGIIGFIILIISYVIVRVIASIFGLGQGVLGS